MHDDYIKNFKVAFGAFCVVFAAIIILFILTFLFKSQSVQTACEAVQNNNKVLVSYLTEAEQRSLQRITAEQEEGKVPLSSELEIKAGFEPLIERLHPIDC